MGSSRTVNVTINMLLGLLCQGVNLIINFVSRTFFIKILGAEYLGVNGLFSNVLSILSFAELGIGNAIVFSMYKPLAVGDMDKLGSLMQLYKKAYRVIGITIAIAGVCITPLLGFVIKNAPDIPENLSLLYLLFLFDTVSSYFFAYKESIIVADQKSYIVLVLTEGVNIVRTVAQIVFLCLTHNFIIFLLLQIACKIIRNLITCVIADRLYPFLKQEAVPLSKDESKSIFKNVRALAMYKFGSVVLNGTDNILVSAMVGVKEVGLVSNYVLLNTSCKAILSKITEAFTASVGNFNAVSDDEKKYEIFNKLFFIAAWMYGFVSVGLITVTTPFITTWIGSEYLLDRITVIAIVGELYFQGVQYAAYTFRTTLGYFVQSRYVPIVAAVANVILSVLLCKWIGLAGIFMATSIARVLCMGIVDPLLLYTKTFHRSPLIYWAKYVGYIALFVVIGAICDIVVNCIAISGWFGVIVQILAVTVIFNGIMVLVFFRTNEFKGLLEYIKGLLKRLSSGRQLRKCEEDITENAQQENRTRSGLKMKKRKIAWIVGAVIVLVLILLGFYKLDGIYARISAVRTAVLTWTESKMMHKETVDLSGYAPLTDEPDAWYTKYHFISHSGGGIDGKTSTNSLQAWESSYARGNRVIDADLSFTSDGVLVLRHDWNDDLEQGDALSGGEMDFDTFTRTKVNYKYDPMTCEDMILFMEEHQDLYVACDMKNDVVEAYQYLVDQAQEKGMDDILDRIIVSIYDYELYHQIIEVYPFQNAAARQYQADPKNYYELAEFCLKNNIHVVNVWTKYIDDEGVRMLENYGIHIYAAVVDDISELRRYHAAERDLGAVSNWLREQDWEFITDNIPAG